MLAAEDPPPYLLAARMYELFERSPFLYTLVLGGNIYENGNIKEDGNLKWRAPYYPLLKSGVEFKPVLGNHDWKNPNIQEQLEFYKILDIHYSFTKDNVSFFALDTQKLDADELNWLENELSHSKSKWKVV